MLLMPIPLTLIAIITGLLLLKKYPRSGKSLIAISACWLALTSWHPVADRLLKPFETQYPSFDIQQPIDAVVVLGGCHASDASMPPASQLCSSSLYRLIEGMRILNANPDAQLLVSGYAAMDERPHAQVLKEVAISLGVPEHRIQTFPTPRDTEEEAQAMHSTLMNKRFALVSEASHLPRAMHFFVQQQLTPIAAPAMRMSKDEFDWPLEARAALKTERAMYEGLGRIWQWFKQ